MAIDDFYEFFTTNNIAERGTIVYITRNHKIMKNYCKLEIVI